MFVETGGFRQLRFLYIASIVLAISVGFGYAECFLRRPRIARQLSPPRRSNGQSRHARSRTIAAVPQPLATRQEKSTCSSFSDVTAWILLCRGCARRVLRQTAT